MKNSEEPQLHLILELEAEAARWRRRTMFLLSVVFHFVLIAVLLVEPRLFRRGAQLMGINLQPERKHDWSFLALPRDLQKRVPPNTNRLSDKNRRAQGRSPLVNPNGLRMPYSRGNTQLPQIAGKEETVRVRPANRGQKAQLRDAHVLGFVNHGKVERQR